mgnify:CR=1 FL=1
MTDYHRDRRKIDPTRAGQLGDGTPNDNDRVEIGPTQLAFREWEAAGLQLPNLAQMRDYRMESNRLVGRLMVLSYPLALDAGARRDSLVDIEALRRQDVSMNVTGSQAMARILRNGLAPKPETVDDFLQGSGTVAFCKEQGLPLADWRAVKPAPPDA